MMQIVPRRRRALALAAGLTLVFAPAATAAAQTAPAAPVPLVAQARADQAGDRYRYLSETEARFDLDGRRWTQTNRLVFDLQVLAARSDGLTLRYTLVEGRVSDPEQRGVDALIGARLDLAIDFEATPQGVPLRLLDAEGYRAAYLARLARLVPGDARLLDATRRRLESQDAVALAQSQLSDVAALAALQLRGALAVGSSAMPESTGPGPDGAPLRRQGEVSVTPAGACRVQVERVVRLASDTSGEGRVAAVGRIATGDGWVVALEQTSRTSGASGTVEEQLRLTRQGAPGCPPDETGGTPA